MRLDDRLRPVTTKTNVWVFCSGEAAVMGEIDKQALAAYSRGDMTALDLRRRLGRATYGEVLRLLSEQGLPLPRAPTAGREAQLARARAWMFPKHAS